MAEELRIEGAPKRLSVIYDITYYGNQAYNIHMDLNCSPVTKKKGRKHYHEWYRSSYDMPNDWHKMSLEEHHEIIMYFFTFCINKLWKKGYIRMIPTEDQLCAAADKIIKSMRGLDICSDESLARIP